MNNQKYIISILLFLIVILLAFIAYLIIKERKTPEQNNNIEISENKYIGTQENKKQDKKEQERTKKVYLGKNLKVPNELGCFSVKDSFTEDGLDQQTIRNNLTKEIKMVLNYYIQNGWMFNQVCRSSDFSVAYSMYSDERMNKNLSNNFIVAFVESDRSLTYFLDERINNPKQGASKCDIYKMTDQNIEFKCNTDNGEKKYRLPFDEEQRVYELK